MRKQHVVVLTSEERARLRALLRRDATTALQQRRARILLAAETRSGYPVQTDVAVALAVGVDPRTVARVRAIFARYGLERALQGRPRVFPLRTLLDSAQEARLTALACGPAPAGHAQWSLRLLAEQLVVLAVVPAISHETVRQTLKKTVSSPGWSSGGSSRPRPAPPLSRPWRTPCSSTPVPPIPHGR